MLINLLCKGDQQLSLLLEFQVSLWLLSCLLPTLLIIDTILKKKKKKKTQSTPFPESSSAAVSDRVTESSLAAPDADRLEMCGFSSLVGSVVLHKSGRA